MKKISFIFLLASFFISFIASAATPVETLKINAALWGADIENSVKAINVAYDAKTDTIFTAGMKSHYIMVTKAGADFPFKSIDLQISTESQTSTFAVDSMRRNLFWINNVNEEIRVINLDTLAIIARKDKTEGITTQFPIKDVALDSDTGWIWVVNTGTKRLTGYSPDLTQNLVATGLQSPFSVDYSATQKMLFVIDALSREQMFLKSFSPSTKQTAQLLDSSKLHGTGRPPKIIRVLGDGAFVTAGQVVTRFDTNLDQKWEYPLKDQVVELLSIGSTVACLMRDVGHKLGDSFSRVALFDTATGQEIATISTRFEAQNIAADIVHNRLFVANGGDGSVSVIDLAQQAVTKTIDVANAAENLVVDTKTGTRYILNRLGGSEIYAWPQGSEMVTRIDGGKWPSELAIDVSRRTLIALSHYESALYLWNLDNPTTRDSFSLTVPHNTGDSLGDLAYDADTGTAAVIFPESGNVVVADVTNKKILWATNFPELKIGANSGPGGAEIAVDGTKQLVCIYDPKGQTVRCYNFILGAQTGTLNLSGQQTMSPQQRPFDKAQGKQRKPKGPKGQKPPLAQGNKPQQGRPEKPKLKSDYAINTTFLNKKQGLLFAGPFVIDVNTFTVKSTLPNVDKIFYADDKIVLGISENRQTQKEDVVVFSATTMTETKRLTVVDTQAIKSEQTYDPSTGLVYISSLPPATVLVFDLK